MAQSDLDYVQLYLALDQATSIRDCLRLACSMSNEPKDSAILPDFMEKVVDRMYCCRNMTFIDLKDILLEPSEVMDMSRFNVENMIKNWEENNGLLYDSLPLVSAGIGYFINKLPTDYFGAMRNILANHMGGVMDLVFLISSQNFEVSAEMGSFTLVVGGSFREKTECANFRSVTFVGGGLNITNVGTVQAIDCSFESCCIGLYLTHVEHCRVQSRGSYADARFKHCDTALFLCHVESVHIRQISFLNCRQVMDAFVSLSFSMVDSEVMFARSIGTLLMKEGKRADFGNNTVNFSIF